MRVLFINPPWVVHRQSNLWRRIASVMPPLGIAWLAAVLEINGHKVKILDAHAEGIAVRDIPQWVGDNGPFDLVGITATTPLITTAMDIARAVKSNFPSCSRRVGRRPSDGAPGGSSVRPFCGCSGARRGRTDGK